VLDGVIVGSLLISKLMNQESSWVDVLANLENTVHTLKQATSTAVPTEEEK